MTSQRKENTPQQEQPNNPMHGVKLATIVEELVEYYGWRDLALEVNINCFKKDPSIKSSLKFLRRTPWARDEVEALYLEMIEKR
ncbi:MAG: VF530 family DNA-binding protein [Flavobacteriales bacterium]